MMFGKLTSQNYINLNDCSIIFVFPCWATKNGLGDYDLGEMFVYMSLPIQKLISSVFIKYM